MNKMDFKEIDLLAANKKELPEKSGLEELYCYSLLCTLYNDFNCSKIDKETGKKIKKTIKSAFLEAKDRITRYDSVYADWQRNTIESAKYISAIKNALEQRADANTVMRLALQLYGVLTNDNVTPRVYIEKIEEKQ